MSSVGVLAAETLSDALVAAADDPAFLPVAEKMILRYAVSGADVSVSIAEAAAELGVSRPTVLEWISKGLLVEVGAPRRSVSVSSLAVVMATRIVADLTHDPRPTAKLLAELSDRHLLARARQLAATSSQDDYVTYTEADLAEIDAL